MSFFHKLHHLTEDQMIGMQLKYGSSWWTNKQGPNWLIEYLIKENESQLKNIKWLVKTVEHSTDTNPGALTDSAVLKLNSIIYKYKL